MRFSLILFLFLILPLHGPLHGEDIIVRLSSEETLAPLYLSFEKKTGENVSTSYLKKLEEILAFDLNYNGSTKVVAASDERKAQSAREQSTRHFDASRWQKLGVEYVVKIEASEKKLAAYFYGVHLEKATEIDAIPLSGDLKVDRARIHQIADALHRTFFKTPGIASTHILYTQRTRQGESSEWISEVWQADYDGGNAHRLTQENALCVTPFYVPSSSSAKPSQFLYVSYKMGQPKIFLGSTQKQESKRLTYLRGNQLMPTLSLQRDKMAFISDITGNPDLFIQNFSCESGLIGTPRQVFSAPHATQGSPTFSPDGRKIAFVSNKDGAPRIYMMDIPAEGASLKTLKPQMISKLNSNNTSPAWSPDGKKIAYSASSPKGDRQIWIYDLTTGQEKSLTEGPGNKESPSWAPNSLHLIFHSSTTKGSDLYLMNINQKKAVKIADTHPGEKRFASWESWR